VGVGECVCGFCGFCGRALILLLSGGGGFTAAMIVAKLGGMSYTSGAKTSITVGTSTFDVSHCTDARWFSFIDVWVVCPTRVSSAWSHTIPPPTPHTRTHASPRCVRWVRVILSTSGCSGGVAMLQMCVRGSDGSGGRAGPKCGWSRYGEIGHCLIPQSPPHLTSRNRSCRVRLRSELSRD
jgi:hypothetical protein